MSTKGYKSFCLVYFLFYRPIIYPIGNGGCFAVAAHLETKYKCIYKIKHWKLTELKYIVNLLSIAIYGGWSSGKKNIEWGGIFSVELEKISYEMFCASWDFTLWGWFLPEIMEAIYAEQRMVSVDQLSLKKMQEDQFEDLSALNNVYLPL